MSPADAADTTRRSMFAGVGAFAALAIPVSALATETDTEIIALGRRYDLAYAASRALGDELDRRCDAADEARPNAPDALRRRPDDWFVGASVSPRGGIYHDDEVAYIAKALPNAERQAAAGINKRDPRRMAEIVEASKTWQTACRAVSESFGVYATCKSLEDADHEVYTLERQIVEAKASTIAGLSVKARVVLRNITSMPDDRDFGEDAALDMAAALAGLAVS